jgi:cellulose synthase/poly-beta-1,6-N-acetylglucosamine synthase-like glycosyltransferase
MSKSDNQHPVVSVIISVYNGQATIVNTLQSVLSQSYIYLEIIIMDDGSDLPVESTINHIKDARIQRYILAKRNGIKKRRTIIYGSLWRLYSGVFSEAITTACNPKRKVHAKQLSLLAALLLCSTSRMAHH